MADVLLWTPSKHQRTDMAIEYQGWATIREAFSEAEEDEARLQEIVDALDRRLCELWQDNTGTADNRGVMALKPDKACMGRYTFENLNGSWRLSVIGSRNHISGDWPHVLALFEWIAAEAPGSYGVLSVIDHESQSERCLPFPVLRQSRRHLGQIWHSLLAFREKFE